MKFYFTYGTYLLGFSAIIAASTITLRYYTCNHAGMATMGDRSMLCDATGADDSATHDNATHGIIKLQEFVFFNTDDLINFEYEKRVRAQHLFEQLCHAKQTDAQRMNIQRTNVQRTRVQRNLFFTRIALHTITMNNHVSYSRQQFGIPHAEYNGNNTSYKNALAKKIATSQLSEKKVSSKKLCMFSALEKLLE